MTSHDAIVFVVDDDPSWREALQCLAYAAGFRVEYFGSAEEFLSSIRPDLPGCLVLDVQLPGMRGLDLQRELAARRIQIPLIFITGFGNIEASVHAMKTGAVDFLAKRCHRDELFGTNRQAIERDRLARQERAEMLEPRRRFSSLTARERLVMGRVVAGLLNKQNATKLSRSGITTKVHRGRLLRKMRAGSPPELVRMPTSWESPQQRSSAPIPRHNTDTPRRTMLPFASSSFILRIIPNIFAPSHDHDEAPIRKSGTAESPRTP